GRAALHVGGDRLDALVPLAQLLAGGLHLLRQLLGPQPLLPGIGLRPREALLRLRDALLQVAGAVALAPAGADETRKDRGGCVELRADGAERGAVAVVL